MKRTDTPYEDLANAIILQAVKDYRKALRYECLAVNNSKYKADIDEIERFFRSGLFEAITNISGEYLIRKLRSEVAA